MGYIHPPKPIMLDRKEDAEIHLPKTDISVSLGQKCFNFAGCILAVIIYFYLLLYSNHLWTIDTALSISLAEYCGWSNARDRKRTALRNENNSFALSEKAPDKKVDSFSSDRTLDALCAIVGYREDPTIFARALESYLTADNCRFVLASVDGDAEEDQEMVNVFKKVNPASVFSEPGPCADHK